MFGFSPGRREVGNIFGIFLIFVLATEAKEKYLEDLEPHEENDSGGLYLLFNLSVICFLWRTSTEREKLCFCLFDFCFKKPSQTTKKGHSSLK